jgi:Ca-activated chloride channel family protein
MSHNEQNGFTGSFKGSESLNETALDAAAFEAALQAGDSLAPVFDEAGHVDEGSVHAWIDGAFDADGAAQVARHVASCATCTALVAEARGLLAGSARILGALDGVARGVVPAADATRTASRIAGAPRTTAAWWRSRWWQAAAGVALVVGVWKGGRREDVVTADAVTAEAVTTTTADTTRTALAGTALAGTALAGTALAGTTLAETTLAVTAPSREAMKEADVATAERVAAAPAAAAGRAAVGAANVAAEMADAPAVLRRATVYGTVRDAATLSPIRGARVQASGLAPTAGLTSGLTATAVMTDLAGRYTLVIQVAPSASVDVQVMSIGYNRYRTAQLVPGDSLRLDVALTASTTALSEVVVTPTPTTTAKRTSVQATSTNRVRAEQSVDASAVSAPAPSFAPTMGRGIAGGIARGREIAVADRRGVPGDRPRRDREPSSREQYDRIEDNPFLGVRTNPMSTFSVDVDRAAYGNVRRFLTQGQRPPKDAVRIEELINYFPYDLPQPKGMDPVSITTDVMAAPWQPKHRLVRVALQSRRIATEALPPNNLVFLIDVSGSMQDAAKLPLVKQSLRLLVDQLRPQDRVAIVAYAGAAGLVLPSTSGDEKVRIIEALDRLEAGGSTAGGAGIELAYRTAREHFLENGNNRVILATDGDFNVGASSDAELERLVERKRSEGTYLTLLGFGMGNYQDAKMEKLAKRGNGNYAYVDELNEARKVLVREMGATLLTVANDVKLQIEFNPAAVQGYRLIGYEDRLLRDEDFNDDKKDAGDMGAGHQVTALYEVVPVGVTGTVTLRETDARRYETPSGEARGDRDELLYVKLRYKRPGESTSQLLSKAVSANVGRGSTDSRFAAAVAAFGMLLRDSEYKGTTSAAQVLEMARAALGDDDGGYRAAFVELVERWRTLGAR